MTLDDDTDSGDASRDCRADYRSRVRDPIPATTGKAEDASGKRELETLREKLTDPSG
jgi:hypothetical protein